MKKFKIASICLGAALVSLVICGYTLREKISVQTQTLTTKSACVAAFGKKGCKLLKHKRKKIYPIRCSIQNNGTSTISLSLENIDLKIVPHKTILSRFKNGSRWFKLLGVGASAFVSCIGVGLIGGLSALAYLGIFTTSSAVAAGDIPFFMYMSVGLGACAGTVAAPTSIIYELTKKQKNKIDSLSLLDTLFIAPGEIRTFFLFVYKRNYKEKFSVTFMDENQNSIPYSIPLQPITA